jgi:hypothetical protein
VRGVHLRLSPAASRSSSGIRQRERERTAAATWRFACVLEGSREIVLSFRRLLRLRWVSRTAGSAANRRGSRRLGKKSLASLSPLVSCRRGLRAMSSVRCRIPRPPRSLNVSTRWTDASWQTTPAASMSRTERAERKLVNGCDVERMTISARSFGSRAIFQARRAGASTPTRR